MSAFSHPSYKVASKGNIHTIGTGAVVPETMSEGVSFILLPPDGLYAGTIRSDLGRTIITGDYGNWVIGLELRLDGYTSLGYFAEKICASPTSITLWDDEKQAWHPWVTTIWEAWMEIKERRLA